MGLESLMSFSFIHDDDPSFHSTSNCHPLVVGFLVLFAPRYSQASSSVRAVSFHVAIVIGIVITAALGGFEGGDLSLEGLDLICEAPWSPCGRSLTVGRPQLALPPFSDDNVAFGKRQVKPLIVGVCHLLFATMQ